MSEYKAQLLAVDAKLVKDPHNEELLSLKADLMELLELSSGTLDEDDEEMAAATNDVAKSKGDEQTKATRPSSSSSIDSKSSQKHESNSNLVDKNSRRPISEADLLAKKKEKNRKKKAKLRERIKEQLNSAEVVQQTWQSFANKKGLKGVTKKSIFASPCSVTGKVGVGTNGIADAPSATSAASLIKRKH